MHGVDVARHELIGSLMKAMQGEYNVIFLLATLAPNEQMKKRILDIQEDEIEHFKAFSYLYSHLTGQQLSSQVTEPMPSTFQDGVVTAFNDEQETTDFYSTVSRELYYEPYIRDEFRYNAADEQRHAVWFLSFMNRG